MNVVEAPRLERARDHGHACAVERCVDDLEVVLALDDLGVDGEGLHLFEVDLVDVFADDLDEGLVAFKLHVLDLHLVNLVDDACVVGGEHLSAVFPVGLVAVILARVVRCRDVDTCLAAQMAYGE